MGNRFGHRYNLIHHTAELWRPPIFTTGSDRRHRFISAVRRFFDLQAGTIWKDLSHELPQGRGTFLDVGCGGQPYRMLIPSSVQYIGIDTIDAKSRFGYETPGTIYFAGDVWPVETASVDFILCSETLEHVREPSVFLKEMYRCVRPGGRIMLTVPFSARWHFVPYDYWRFTPSGLELLLDRAGFAELEVYARGNSFTVACYKQMTLILSLLLSCNSSVPLRWAFRLLGVIGLPILVVSAVAANLSLRLEGGDDCLGYTILARRRDAGSSPARP